MSVILLHKFMCCLLPRLFLLEIRNLGIGLAATELLHKGFGSYAHLVTEAKHKMRRARKPTHGGYLFDGMIRVL